MLELKEKCFSNCVTLYILYILPFVICIAVFSLSIVNFKPFKVFFHIFDVVQEQTEPNYYIYSLQYWYLFGCHIVAAIVVSECAVKHAGSIQVAAHNVGGRFAN